MQIIILTMSKIKNFTNIISTTKRFLSISLLNKPTYGISRIAKKSASQIFGKSQPPKQQKPSFVGNRNIDHLTKDTLNQYQQKLRQIREQHTLLQQKISLKYEQLIKSLQNSLNLSNLNSQKRQLQEEQISQEQQKLEGMIDQLKTKRLDEIVTNQSVLKNKVDKLTSDYNINFAKARKQYELQYIKKYMLQNMKELKQEPSELQKLLKQKNAQNQPAYIPNNLIIKKLYFKTTDGKERQVLLTGIEENDQDHCAYVKTLIQKLKIKHVLTMMPPDLPYFIKTQTSFLVEWMQFLKAPTPQTKFYLNPSAKTLSDITLQRSFIPHVLNGMTKSKSFYQTAFSLMQMNEVNFKYEHQPLYSGLIASTADNVYFCDYPFLKQRQMIALNMKLEDLRQLLKQHAYYKQTKNQHFSAELLLPKNVVQKKFRHIIKLAKTVSLVTQSSPMLICDASIAEVLAEEWKKSPLQFLQFDYSQNTYLLDMELYKIPQEQVLFIEFIEKLVILDVILSPLIQNYFVKYESFPYSCRNTVGGKQNLTKVFLLWRHYFNLYSNAVKGKFDLRKEHGQYV